MEVIINVPQKIVVNQLIELTVEQFLSCNHSSESIAWIDGYLIMFTHHDPKYFDAQIEKGIWSFRNVEYAKMPEFKETLQGRHNKISIFDQTGTPIMHEIVKWIEKCKT